MTETNNKNKHALNISTYFISSWMYLNNSRASFKCVFLNKTRVRLEQKIRIRVDKRGVCGTALMLHANVTTSKTLWVNNSWTVTKTRSRPRLPEKHQPGETLSPMNSFKSFYTRNGHRVCGRVSTEQLANTAARVCFPLPPQAATARPQTTPDNKHIPFILHSQAECT